MLSLTDMWKASKSPEDKRPAEWARKQGAELIAFMGDTLNMATGHIYDTRRGRYGGGTWGHWQIAFAYAKYLSHEFHAYCNTVVREHLERMREGRLPLQAQMVRRQRLHLMQICHCTYCSRYLLPNPC